jgi:phage terminase small subunit
MAAEAKPAKRRAKVAKATKARRKKQSEPSPKALRIPHGPALRALAPRQREFVRAYCGLTGAPRAAWQGAAAARAVGYSEATASALAHELLGLPKVRAAIAEVVTELQAQHAALARRCIDELTAIAFTNLDDVVDPDTGRMRPRDEISSSAMAAVAEISVVDGEKSSSQKVKMHSKVGAIQLLARMIGYLQDSGGGVHLNMGVTLTPGVTPDSANTRPVVGATVEQMSKARVAFGLPAIDATAVERADDDPPE